MWWILKPIVSFMIRSNRYNNKGQFTSGDSAKYSWRAKAYCLDVSYKVKEIAIVIDDGNTDEIKFIDNDHCDSFWIRRLTIDERAARISGYKY